jgi:hypothetical protein
MFAAVACALTVSVSAQTTSPTGGASPPTFGMDKKVTITGCLERSQESVATNDRFVLNNIVPNAPAIAGTAGTSGWEKAPKATSYRLNAEDSKLSPHVGHKLEITGTVEDRPMSAVGTAGASGSATEAPKFKVEAIKMIASSCTV